MRTNVFHIFVGVCLTVSALADDGRLEISQAQMPLTITAPGSYVVTENLSGAAGQNGLTINADNVSIDLNGFTLNGVTTNSLNGIVVTGDPRNLVVRNGIIKNWGDNGLDATNAVNGRFEGIIVSRNGNAGMEVGFNCVVSRCISYQNGTLLFPSSPATANDMGDGFRIENGSTASMLLSVQNSHHAIRGHSGSSIRQSVMYQNGHDGFHGSHATVIEGCVAAKNSEGIEADSGSRIARTVAAMNVEDGIRNKGADTNLVLDVSGGGVFSGNVAYSNQSNNIDIRGPGTLVEGCVSAGSDSHGIRVEARSMVRGNLSAWAMGGGDNFHIEAGHGSRLEGNHSIELSGNTDEGIQLEDDIDGLTMGNLVVQNSASGPKGIKMGVGNHGEEGNPGDLSGDHSWINFEYEP